MAYLVDADQSRNELHHHNLDLKALFGVFQLLQELLREVLTKMFPVSDDKADAKR